MDEIPEWIQEPNREPFALEATLKLTVDDAAMKAALNAFERAAKEGGR
jgi:hypothetical protein